MKIEAIFISTIFCNRFGLGQLEKEIKNILQSYGLEPISDYYKADGIESSIYEVTLKDMTSAKYLAITRFGKGKAEVRVYDALYKLQKREICKMQEKLLKTFLKYGNWINHNLDKSPTILVDDEMITVNNLRKRLHN